LGRWWWSFQPSSLHLEKNGRSPGTPHSRASFYEETRLLGLSRSRVPLSAACRFRQPVRWLRRKSRQLRLPTLMKHAAPIGCSWLRFGTVVSLSNPNACPSSHSRNSRMAGSSHNRNMADIRSHSRNRNSHGDSIFAASQPSLQVYSFWLEARHFWYPSSLRRRISLRRQWSESSQLPRQWPAWTWFPPEIQIAYATRSRRACS